MPDDDLQPLPNGFRQGIITAITVLLGFSLLFLRFWSFELPGKWTSMAIVATVLLGLSIVVQFVALWRALQIEDDTRREYRKTLRWFLASIILTLASLVLVELITSGLLGA
jgi:hypothetical protein